MAKTIILTESQFTDMIRAYKPSFHPFRGCRTPREYARKLALLIMQGALTFAIAEKEIDCIKGFSTEQKVEIKKEIIRATEETKQIWKPIANDVIVTVYNAKASQCNADFGTTASNFKLDLSSPQDHKILAMERTFMEEFGVKYGDVVKLEGTAGGKFDGIYQVQDTMNKRFAGQHKVDILVNNDITYGGTHENKPATIYVLNDKELESDFKSFMLKPVK